MKLNRMSVLKWSAFFLLFGVGLAMGWFLRGMHEFGTIEKTQGYQIRQGGYRLINPLLECEMSENTLRERELRPFRADVESLIDHARAENRVGDVSVYFRDLDTGASFNINANAGYSPASLAKLPVLIAYLKMAEKDSGLLSRKIMFNGDRDWSKIQNIKSARMLEQGHSYTVDDLLYRMMAYSDNDAWSLLFNGVDVAFLDKILADLGVDYDKTKEEDIVTVKSYARFLRILYNASYLSKPMSEKALQFLTAGDFPQGLVAGVPPNTLVASKFGERTLGVNGELKQLHDFGIIYYPGRPYLLCVMTRGGDFDKLASVIRDISMLVYDKVDLQTKLR